MLRAHETLLRNRPLPGSPSPHRNQTVGLNWKMDRRLIALPFGATGVSCTTVTGRYAVRSVEWLSKVLALLPLGAMNDKHTLLLSLNTKSPLNPYIELVSNFSSFFIKFRLFGFFEKNYKSNESPINDATVGNNIVVVILFCVYILALISFDKTNDIKTLY